MVAAAPRTDHRCMTDRSTDPEPIHGPGMAYTFLVALPALWVAARLLFSGSCSYGPTADEIRTYRLLVVADTAVFAAVPTAIGVWAWRRGREPRVWWGFAALAFAAGTLFALNTEPAPLFCF
jgi:hypothetical protein